MASQVILEDSDNSWSIDGLQDYSNYQRYQQTSNGKTYSRSGIMDANEYRLLGDLDHVLEAPEMYIDFMGILMRKEAVFNGVRMVCAEIGTPPAMIRIFIEVIANSIDNANKSRRACVNPGVIKVEIKPDYISIYNEGMAMCIAMHPDKPDMWIPSVNFGMTKSSSNFTSERHEIGRNGIGCKAANIMSRHFQCEVSNSRQGLLFVQEWTNNMRTPKPPVITQFPPDSIPNYTKVSYQLDWSRFQYPHKCYTQEMYAIVARVCADASFASRVPVYMNEKQFYNPDLLSLSKLYFGEVKNYILYYVWPMGVEYVVNSDRTETAKDGNTSALIEMAILDTPDSGMNISFVNGLNTANGGVHLDAALKSSMKHILNSLNGKSGNTSAEEKKKKAEERKRKLASGILITDDKDKKKEYVPKVNKNDMKRHLSIIVSVKVTNPAFDSQSKTMLRSPKIQIEIPKEKLQCMHKWEVAERMKNILHGRQVIKLKSTDGKKTKNTKCDSVEDANLAGTGYSQDCTLIVTEGDSAKTEGRTIIGLHPRGRDVIGLYALRGKIRNAIKASPLELMKNAEIINIKEILGLQETLDYTNPTNRATLRYGSIMIMTDQDVDGLHIKGLLLAYFFKYFPSLFTIGFITDFRTPSLRVSKGGQKFRFFNEQEYNTWKATVEDPKSWLHKYFKGLGSAKPDEVAEDYHNPNIVTYYLDQDSGKVIEMAFGEKHANDRKLWISHHNPSIPKPPACKQMTVSSFILYEMIDYPINCLKRAIPRLDGEKESQRKCLYAICKKFGMKVGAKPQKIGTLAANAIEVTNYHHGDSLPDVITYMAYDFVGSNNLPFFGRESALGTRLEGGKDAAQARYTFTNLNWWLPVVYRKEDECILDYLEDEGEIIEPEILYPILPIHLINGVNGVAVAWRTFMPCHHPIDVANWYMHRIAFHTGNAAVPPPDIKPWYRGYLMNDSIQIMDKRRTKLDMANENARKEWMINNGINPNAEYVDIDYKYGEQMGVKLEDFEDSFVFEDSPPPSNGHAMSFSNSLEANLNIIQSTSQNMMSGNFSGNYSGDMSKMDITVVPNVKVENPNQKVVGTGRYSMITSGKFHWDPSKKVLVVTELPIGLWTLNYENWLKQLRKEKLITDYRTLSNDTTIYFEIENFQPTLGDPNVPRVADNGNAVITARDLQLVKSYGLTTLILLDEKGRPRVFSDIRDVLEYFYNWRLSIYERRRLKMIEILRVKLEDLEGRIQYVKAVIGGKLILFQGDNTTRPKDELLVEMDALKLKHKYLKTQSDAYTREKYAKLVAEYEKLLAEIKMLEATDPRMIWMGELQEFVTEYNKHYKNDKAVKSDHRLLHYDGNKITTRRSNTPASSSTVILEDSGPKPSSSTVILEDSGPMKPSSIILED